MGTRRRIIVALPFACLTLSLLLWRGGQAAAPPEGDRYVLPGGAGTKDGSSWENALEAAGSGLQKGWDALSAGGTLWVGSGAYPGDLGLVIRSGGEKGRYKRLMGKDTGGGLPTFAGTFDRARPDKTGKAFVTAEGNVGYWWVQDVRLRDYQMGVLNRGGSLTDVRIVHLEITGCREGVSLDGGGAAATPETTGDIEIRDCVFRNYTKRGVRLKNSIHGVTIVRCEADAGGKPWATEPFQMGFQIAGGSTPVHHITFSECTARNNYDEQGGDNTKYWNADGFVAESGSHDLRYVRCRAFDNTDGGWDDKAKNSLLIGCVALRNKRNYRFWGEATLENCLGAYAIRRGGSGSADGIWASGKVVARRSTFHNNGTGVRVSREGSVELSHCILSRDGEHKGGLTAKEDQGTVVFKETAEWQGEAATNPRFVGPREDWNGVGTAFDSASWGADKGYNSATPNGVTTKP